MSATPVPAADDAIDRLRSLDTAGLRQAWQRLYRAEPPRVSRDLLLLGLAHRLQAQQQPSLARVAERQLRSLGAGAPGASGRARTPPVALKPGARLVREWHGRTHVITVVAGGYEHDGRTYRSLSTIAREITGARWSGPRFFGLPSARPTSRDA